ncbi:MAG: chloride channel protein [Halopseudomonas sp.]
MNSLSLNHFRLRAGDVDALPQWLLIGLLSGLVTGLIMLAFHFAITWPLEQTLPGGDPENFEGLPPLVRLLLPILGSLLLGLLLWRFAAHAQVGIPHVLERLSYHQGRLPLANVLIQFVAGAISLTSGHSGGREGPAVHLGAGTSSLLGQYLRLPNNSLRTLIGCGTAAAIAAAFNTPIAGIIFAMEVVIMEYTIAGFIPVMIAAITSTLLLRLTLGDYIAFDVPALPIQTLQEVPFIILLGVVLGLLAVLFSKILVTIASWQKPSLFIRLQIAGVATGVTAWFLPEIMGIGYDSVSQILSGQGTLEFFVALTIAKLLITAIAVGLGVPMGLIGPTLVIGAAAGAAMGMIGIAAAGAPVSDLALYAMLGMGAMMAATLQAPLAALLALLELTLNAHIIFPGALAIITATLTYRYCFRQGSAFQALLLSKGLDWRRAPLARFLERTSVSMMMQPYPPQSPRVIDRSQAEQLIISNSEWILVLDQQLPKVALARADLELYLQPKPDQAENLDPAPIDLMAIPALRHDLTDVSIQASLHEALETLNEHNFDALWVRDHTGQLAGLLLRDTINHHFTHQKSD